MALAFRNQFYLQKSVTITSADHDLKSPAVKLLLRKNQTNLVMIYWKGGCVSS